MARLTLKLHGSEVSRLTLESGVEYIAGRAQDAQIQLSSERGISRHHLKFYERDGVWVCESLSKFVLIQIGGDSVEVLELNEPKTFSVPPYEFAFEPNPKEKPVEKEKSENLPAISDTSSHGQTGTRAHNEATIAASSNLIPYIRISFPNKSDDEILKLEGHLWIAGRDPSCEISIDNANISRKHFELSRTKEGFFITDLGSSNGTKVNGRKIPPHEPTRIESGDEIQVKSVEMAFEIRDANFNNRIDSLPVPAFDPLLAMPPQPWYPPEQMESTESRPQNKGPRSLKEFRLHHLKIPAVRKRAIRTALMFSIPLLLLGILMPSNKEQPKRDPDKAANTSVSFDKLTVEQKSVVKDSFSLARNLYVQGKYELCLTELAKVHELIPLYENSRELQSFCEQGRELVKRQEELERREKERLATEQFISGIVENCKNQLKDQGTVDETRQCLAEAIERDPEHRLVVEMIHSAQTHEEELKFNQKMREEQRKKVAKGMAHYNRAKASVKTGTLYKAVGEYEKYLNTPYPGADETKAKARKELEAIKKELKTKVDFNLDQCKTLGGKNQYKEAYKACDLAAKEDPDNSIAKETRSQMVSELKRELKGIYEDSVLEESLGNVDSAKERWKKIMKDDIEGGEYYLKAKSKLQKYGVGI